MSNLLSKLLPFGGILEKALERLFPDPKARADAELEVLKMHQAGEFRTLDSLDASDRNQARINEIEASSQSWVKSWWRPGAGWACVAGLWYQLLLAPLLWWIAQNALGWTHAPPTLDLETLLTLLFGLLGLGAYRTYEKTRK